MQKDVLLFEEDVIIYFYFIEMVQDFYGDEWIFMNLFSYWFLRVYIINVIGCYGIKFNSDKIKYF